jgi:cadmium resistance protein CadD (predicted permease)
LEKGQKPKSGKQNDKRKLKVSKSSSKIQKVSSLVLGQSFEEMAILVPYFSKLQLVLALQIILLLLQPDPKILHPSPSQATSLPPLNIN